MTKIRWQSVRENIPGAIKAEDAIVNGRWVELRLMPEGEGFKVEIRFIRDGIKLETWTHSYRVQGMAESGYQTVRERAERWLGGLGLRGLRPDHWHRTKP